MENKVLSSSPWDPLTGHGNGPKPQCRALHGTLGSISVPKGWSNTGTGFLDGWLMLQACPCLRGTWIVPRALQWSALNWSFSLLDAYCRFF